MWGYFVTPSPITYWRPTILITPLPITHTHTSHIAHIPPKHTHVTQRTLARTCSIIHEYAHFGCLQLDDRMSNKFQPKWVKYHIQA